MLLQNSCNLKTCSITSLPLSVGSLSKSRHTLKKSQVNTHGKTHNFNSNYFIRFKQWEIYAIDKFLLGFNNLHNNNYGVLTPFFPVRALPVTNASSNQAWKGRKRLLVSKAYTATADLCCVSKDQVPQGRTVLHGFSQRPCHCWKGVLLHLP